jgi:hypothetical protein
VRPFNLPVPEGHRCWPFVLRADATHTYTLCEHGHVVKATTDPDSPEWQSHVRHLHERHISGHQSQEVTE